MKPIDIAFTMSKNLEIPIELLRDKSRRADTVAYRRLFAHLCKNVGITQQETAEFLKQADHTTVHHHLNTPLSRDEVDKYVKCILNVHEVNPKHHRVRYGI